MSIKQVLVLPNDPAALKEIRNCIQEVSGAMTRMDAEQEYIKTAIEDISEKYDLPKAQVKKIANVYHKSNRDAIIEEAQNLDEAYDKIFVLKNSENQ